jgi:hypothetical protein
VFCFAGIVHCDEIAPAPAVWMYANESRVQRKASL